MCSIYILLYIASTLVLYNSNNCVTEAMIFKTETLNGICTNATCLFIIAHLPLYDYRVPTFLISIYWLKPNLYNFFPSMQHSCFQNHSSHEPEEGTMFMLSLGPWGQPFSLSVNSFWFISWNVPNLIFLCLWDSTHLKGHRLASDTPFIIFILLLLVGY